MTTVGWLEGAAVKVEHFNVAVVRSAEDELEKKD